MKAAATASNALITALAKDSRSNLSKSALLYVINYAFLTLLACSAAIIIEQFLLIMIVIFFSTQVGSLH